MKKAVLLLVVLLAGRLVPAQVPAAGDAPAHLLVCLSDDLRADLQKPLPGKDGPAARFAQLNRRYGAAPVQPLNPRKGATDAPAQYLITLPAGAAAEAARRDYQHTGLFRYVELDGQGQGGGTLGVVPNDNQYGWQWYLKNNGTFAQSPSRAGADIRMEDAWAISQGDTTVTVAVIDSGCKMDHPELARRIWRNRQEIAGNGVDDDLNGYVDDVNGWNFADGDNSPADAYGHGTNVTGIIGATGNNGIGYAGVNWGCKLLICRALDANNNGFYSWWISAIYYAVDNGARVINMSLGGTSSSQAMQDAVAYANRHGAVVVACMMNTNSSVVYYPAGLTGVVAVGATNPNDRRVSPFFWSPTSGSNFGPHIALVAPGNYIYGLSNVSNVNYSSYWGGTSQASPLVAGVASLLLTLRPALTPTQVDSILRHTADDRVGDPLEDVVGWDRYYGHGRLNAARALAGVVTGSRAAQAMSAGFRLFPNPAHGPLTLQLTDARLLGREVEVFNSLGQVVSRQVLGSLVQALPVPPAAGAYWVAVAGSGGRRLLVE